MLFYFKFSVQVTIHRMCNLSAKPKKYLDYGHTQHILLINFKKVLDKKIVVLRKH